LPDGDILVHAGDYTYRGDARAKTLFYDWFFSQSHPFKVFIAGNHDFDEPARGLTTGNGGFYLHDSSVVIAGLKFWGSPYTPRFYDWAWMYDNPTDRWEQIPLDTDVLVTHGPPYGILDLPFGKPPHVGCEQLALRVAAHVRPQCHVFGHIYGNYGRTNWGGTEYVNASVVNEAYKVVNAPVVVDLEPRPKPQPAIHLGHHHGPVHPDILKYERPK
jgi:Icc-related predicted phosphoesterase